MKTIKALSGCLSVDKLVKIISYFFYILLLSLSISPILKGQNEVKQKFANSKKAKITFIPAIAYTPETQLAAGGALLTILNNQEIDNKRKSNARLAGLYTTERQVILEAQTFLFLKEEEYIFRGKVVYKFFPEFYFGIGDNTPESNREQVDYSFFRVEARSLKCLKPSLFVGLDVRMTTMWNVKPSSNGILESSQIAGFDGSFVSEAGPALIYDSRDNIINSSKGMYLEFVHQYNGKYTGSEFEYSRHILDFRRFWTFSKKQNKVFAFRAYALSIFGNAPFKYLAELGGGELMRGYYQGRYRDNHIAVSQLEYRMPVWKFIGLVGFASFGNVAHTWQDFNLRRLKTSFGGGLRFRVNKEDNINIRVDYGIGQDGNSGLYFGIGEAF